MKHVSFWKRKYFIVDIVASLSFNTTQNQISHYIFSISKFVLTCKFSKSLHGQRIYDKNRLIDWWGSKRHQSTDAVEENTVASIMAYWISIFRIDVLQKISQHQSHRTIIGVAPHNYPSNIKMMKLKRSQRLPATLMLSFAFMAPMILQAGRRNNVQGFMREQQHSGRKIRRRLKNQRRARFVEISEGK